MYFHAATSLRSLCQTICKPSENSAEAKTSI
jgi:hypothetical protein